MSQGAQPEKPTQDLDSDVTFTFDPSGREEYADVMTEYGYVEISEFAALDTTRGYFCGSCVSMVDATQGGSPTGYWCKKFGFPDRPNGCCDGWSPK